MEMKVTTVLSKLSNAEEDILKDILSSISYCISDCVYEDMNKRESISQIDLEFGKLFIQNEDGKLKFKFVPCKELIEDLKNIANNKQPNITKELSKKAGARLNDLYKGLI